jgi:hypothetical protein
MDRTTQIVYIGYSADLGREDELLRLQCPRHSARNQGGNTSFAAVLLAAPLCGSAAEIVRILVVGVDTADGFRAVAPGAYFSLFGVKDAV